MTALLLIPYFIIGLFISRWWWRLDVRNADDDPIFAYAIFVGWPLFLAGLTIFMFVKWFYGQPRRRRF